MIVHDHSWFRVTKYEIKDVSPSPEDGELRELIRSWFTQINRKHHSIIESTRSAESLPDRLVSPLRSLPNTFNRKKKKEGGSDF